MRHMGEMGGWAKTNDLRPNSFAQGSSLSSSAVVSVSSIGSITVCRSAVEYMHVEEGNTTKSGEKHGKPKDTGTREGTHTEAEGVPLEWTRIG